MKKLVLNKVFCGFLTAVTIMACEAKLALAGGPSQGFASHAQTSGSRSSNYLSVGSMNAANSPTFMGNYGQSTFVSTNNANQGLIARHNFTVPISGNNSVYVPKSTANEFKKVSAFNNELPMKTAGKILPINTKFDSPKIIANQSRKVNLIKPISGSLALSGTASSGVQGSAAPIALIKAPPKTSPIVSALNHNSAAGTKPVAIRPILTHPTGSQVHTEPPINRAAIDWNAIRTIILAAGARIGQDGGVVTQALNYRTPGDPDDDDDGEYEDWGGGGGDGGDGGGGGGGGGGGSADNNGVGGGDHVWSNDEELLYWEELAKARERDHTEATRPEPLNPYGFWIPWFRDTDTGEWVWLWLGPNGIDGKKKPKP
jgi:hypothetical protein